VKPADNSLKLSRVIREHCELVIAAEEGHVRRAAIVLGIAWTTLYRWMAEWKAEDQAIEDAKLKRKSSHSEDHVNVE